MIELLLRGLAWINEHPERWVPVVLALVSMLATYLKDKSPKAAKVLSAIVELGPNIPGFISKCKGLPPPAEAPKPEDKPL